MRLLKAGSHRRMAWKNGGGETIEIAVHPPDAGLAGFDWRVSMATVAVDGPFSLFPGIDRTLSVLDGAGMDLEIEGLGRRRLTAETAPLFFPADARTEARLAGGPITDLNVMTRRGACRHDVTRIALRPNASLSPGGRWNLLVAAGPCRVEAEGFSGDMSPGDALLAERALRLSVEARREMAAVYVVEIADAD